MICLSERLVARIRETPGSSSPMSSPLLVIDSCTVSTFWLWWLREPGPDWSPESGSSGWVTGPHSKPVLGDLCPERETVVNPLLSDLETTDHCIDVEQWRLRAAEGPTGLFLFHFLFACLPVLLCLSYTFCLCSFTGNKGILEKPPLWSWSRLDKLLCVCFNFPLASHNTPILLAILHFYCHSLCVYNSAVHGVLSLFPSKFAVSNKQIKHFTTYVHLPSLIHNLSLHIVHLDHV